MYITKIGTIYRTTIIFLEMPVGTPSAHNQFSYNLYYIVPNYLLPTI